MKYSNAEVLKKGSFEMQRKTISLVLCFAMLLSMFVFAVPANAATVDSAAAGLSKIESADDFSWDNVNMYFLLTDRFYNGNTSNDHAYGRALDANGQPLSGEQVRFAGELIEKIWEEEA